MHYVLNTARDVSCGTTKGTVSTWCVTKHGYMASLHILTLLFVTSFIQLLNWDWSANRPREETGQENAWDPGWYSNAASILRPPLLDPSVPATELAQWIDNNTIAIHHLLLPHIDQITKSDEASFAFSLPSNNSYWEQLQSRM